MPTIPLESKVMTAMATIEKYSGKDGLTYRITVYAGFDTQGKRIRHRMNYKPTPGMTARQIEKAAQRAAADFERSIEQGFALDNRQSFADYASYVINLKERTGTKHRTIDGYRRLQTRTNQAIGHMALQDIRAFHLNQFYQNLAETGIRATASRAVPKPTFRDTLKEKKLSMAKVAKLSGVAESTVNAAGKGNAILKDKGIAIAQAAEIPFEDLFTADEKNDPLSNTSILAYHRFIHVVLAQAEKEMLVPYNAADKATPPQKEKSEVGTFQTSELIAIRDAAAKEPVKWQTIIHLLMITGCRRGEIVGLKWDKVNWKDSSIRIDTTLLYTPARGVYESTTKTGADRTIKLPKETMDLLRQYRVWQLETRLANGDRWQDTPYVFTGECGGCMAPDTLSGYLTRFEKKYNLPHIHAHKFRHSMASVLYFSGADPVSISKRLGHAQVSTTQNIYSHLIEQADTQSAERIADAIFRSEKKSG